MLRPERKNASHLDTDANNELDDQHAIAYLLANENYFDVEGMTVNTTTDGREQTDIDSTL